MSMKFFTPRDSKVSPEVLSDFLRCQITGNLLEIPGVGKATVAKLAECDTILSCTPGNIRVRGVTSTFGLIGLFMCFKNAVDEDGNAKFVGPVEHAQRFYDWLCHIKTPSGHRAGIVDSIGQKVNIAFPGIYDPSVYPDEEETGGADEEAQEG